MLSLFPGRSGQASMEYLMIAAFIGILIVPATFIYYHYATESSQQIDKAQVDRIGHKIISTAERFYYHGYPSTIVIQETMPANVLNLSIHKDTIEDTYVLVVALRDRNGNSTFGFSTNVKINGTFGERAISAGKKNIRFSVAPGNKPFVAINMEDGECQDGAIKNGCCDSSSPQKRCFNGILIEDTPNLNYCANPPSTC